MKKKRKKKEKKASYEIPREINAVENWTHNRSDYYYYYLIFLKFILFLSD